jgi:hypothetical protein
MQKFFAIFAGNYRSLEHNHEGQMFFERSDEKEKGTHPPLKKYMYKDLQIISTKCDSNEHH